MLKPREVARRIGLAVVLTLGLTLAPLAVGAQMAGPAHRIGVLLHDCAPPGLLESFREELHKLGYVAQVRCSRR